MTLDELQAQNAELTRRLQESEEMVRAIQEGTVDAFLMQDGEGARVYTLEGADHPYRILVEQMNQGAATLDAAGNIAYCNLSLAELLRLPLERVIGQSFREFVPPNERAFFDSLFSRGRAGPSRGEIQLQATDGVLVPAYLIFNALPQQLSAAAGVVVMDLTCQKHQAELAAAYHMLQRREREVREANEDLQQFAFAASHDLQEPLRMITSYSQMLVKRHAEFDGESEVCVRFINEGTQRMRDLLSDLLSYTEIHSHGEQSEVVDLNLICEEALKNLNSSVVENNAVVICGRLPIVHGRNTYFLQLFQNLIANSIKYRSEAAPRIEISAVQEGGEWRIAVADNGIGIHPDYHHKIFGVFKRLHGKRIPGTGIGLAICQRVVERNGGRIWVDSQINQGATFYFTISQRAEGVAG